MLREESQVNTYEHNKKMGLGQASRQRKASNQIKSEGQATKNRENSAYPQNIMEMSYHIISIV